MYRGLVIVLIAFACGCATVAGIDHEFTLDDSTGAEGGEPLYPIAVGNTWSYTEAKIGDPAPLECDIGQTYTELKVLSVTTVDEKIAYEMSRCHLFYLSPGTGDQVDIYRDSQWCTYLDPTLEDGHTWACVDQSYTWLRVETITVPAGTFTDCWTVSYNNIGDESFNTYCRSVGPVRAFSVSNGVGLDLQLAAKNF